ncbi:MAG TPA: hypothetical protein VL126_04235 [Bacteroidota bacterium]|nr:hypothetical protein [Bacteroidota bacterium]
MGRQAILMVLGYSLVFLMSGSLASNATVDAFNNAMSYYQGNIVRDIAISGANMGANYIFLNRPLMNSNPWWSGWTTPVNLNGGTFTVRMDSVKDMYGNWGRIQMTVNAHYDTANYSVTVLFHPSTFSKFCLYAGSMTGVYFEPTDSVFGPCHIESTLNYGNPSGGIQSYGAYFGGKVTTKTGIAALTNPAKMPTFAQGREDGVSIPQSLNTTQLVSEAGANLFTGGNLYLNLKDDSVSYATVKTGPYTTKAISQIAPNGVLAIDKGTLYIQGELSVPLTVASVRSSGSSGGTITVKDNVTYKTDPRTDPNCNALLGIVAYSTINIDTTASHNNFTVDGSMYSQTDGVQVVNYNTRPRGNLYVLGGWQGTKIYATSNGTTAGLPVNVTYDERFRVESPPFFPGTNAYEILSWYE